MSKKLVPIRTVDEKYHRRWHADVVRVKPSPMAALNFDDLVYYDVKILCGKTTTISDR
jgi:hypothetical protein